MLPVNILIVDDEPKNLSVLESVLDHPGYRLVRAGSGEEALMALMNDEFAVLILDVRMPGMSGFEVAQLVKERRKTANIPILFLTAYYNEDQHVLEGYGSGAVDYLHKPVNAAVLRSKVAVFSELHRSRLALEDANRQLLSEIAERRKAEGELNELNASLDRRVQERTQELQVSEQKLLEANRKKDEFLATLAHELRNPLAPVRNALEVLKIPDIDGDKRAWAMQLIDRQILQLSRLIDDLMDANRIGQGRIELQREVFSLTDLVSEAVENARPLMDEHEHQLRVAMADKRIELFGDRMRLVQALVNLLSNAAKYTQCKGQIELSVEAQGGNAIISIADDGIGIAPSHTDSIFEMFSQVEGALTRSRGGLGIGLALTRKLVQLHGGSVQAFSEGLGRGSRFVVTLPLYEQKADENQTSALPVDELQAPGSVSKLRILIADDNVDSAESLAALLQLLGHELMTVFDGEAAVHAARDLLPDLVILDIGMPKMNGFDACRAIRTMPHGRTCTIAAVTGWGQSQDLERSRQSGFDRHLVKPVQLDKLYPLLDQALARRAEQAR